ncbi:2TM domain-containing protein [Methanobrevibacter sp.]|uniref:2TM domain-containing protein n=1 Tax=Methanobrevibacter sp. TaxID=66852 RepID=UPI00388E91B7
MNNVRQRAEERVDRKIKFYRNFLVYIIVNAMLFIINWYFTPEFWWAAFPLFFWGIRVLKDFLMAFVFDDKFGEDYRERKIQEEMEKLRI